jgi:hypothetical protein
LKEEKVHLKSKASHGRDGVGLASVCLRPRSIIQTAIKKLEGRKGSPEE